MSDNKDNGTDKRINYKRLNNDEYNWIIRRINELLNEYGWTVYKLAKESGIPYSSLNNYYLRNTMPTIETLERITAAFGITLSNFFLTQPIAPPIKLEGEAQAQARKFLMLGLMTGNENESVLLQKYRLLSEGDKARLEGYLDCLINRND